MSMPINRNQALFMRWYEEYRERRYLADAPDDAVMQRARELISNICTLEQNGKIGCVQAGEQSGFFLMRLFSHLLEESRLRTGHHQGLFIRHGLRDVSIPRSTSPEPPASEAVLRISREQTGHRKLLKFGQRKWMHALLNHGRIRIAPASMYQDPSLGPAIADDELSYDLATTAFDADILSLDPFQTRLADAFGEPATAPRRLTMETNYYVWCASLALRPRLFGDFNDADTVLVLHDVAEFTRRLIQAIRDPLDGWQFTPCAVHYFDPYHPSQQTRNVFACKHFKYLYQEEFRYVFLPSSPVTKLEPLSLELGSLADIAEV